MLVGWGQRLDGWTAGGIWTVSSLGKYIPGNPTFIVQNMTGAGGVIAANYVYSVAKPDGLTLGTFGPSMYFDQLAKRPMAIGWSRVSGHSDSFRLSFSTSVGRRGRFARRPTSVEPRTLPMQGR